MFKDSSGAGQLHGIAAHRNFGASLGYKGTSLSGDGLLVSGSYFPGSGSTPRSAALTPDATRPSAAIW